MKYFVMIGEYDYELNVIECKSKEDALEFIQNNRKDYTYMRVIEGRELVIETSYRFRETQSNDC